MHVGPVVSSFAAFAPQPASASGRASSEARPGEEPTQHRHGQSGVDSEATVTNEADRRQIQSLKVRDREVRAHEQAHVAAAGGLAKGGASFNQVRGPDGRLYAIGGEVQIDTSPVSGDPRATIAKAQRVRRAALAPAEPSGQDRQVAAQASATEREARTELLREEAEKLQEATRPAIEDARPVPKSKSDFNRQRIDVAIDLSPAALGGFVGSA